MVIVPTPATARYMEIGEPSPPAPAIKICAFFQPLLAFLAKENHLPLVSFEFPY